MDSWAKNCGSGLMRSTARPLLLQLSRAQFANTFSTGWLPRR